MTKIPKFISKFSAIPIIFPAGFFKEIDKLILKIIWIYSRKLEK